MDDTLRGSSVEFTRGSVYRVPGHLLIADFDGLTGAFHKGPSPVANGFVAGCTFFCLSDAFLRG